MKKTIAIAMLSIFPMMLVSCGTPRLESQRYQEDAPLTIQPVDDCVWVDTNQDVLAGYEWVGEVSDEEADPDIVLYLHCYTGAI